MLRKRTAPESNEPHGISSAVPQKAMMQKYRKQQRKEDKTMTDQEKDFMKVLGLTDEDPADQKAVKGNDHEADPAQRDQGNNKKPANNKDQGDNRNKETNRTKGNRTAKKEKDTGTQNNGKTIIAKPESKTRDKLEPSWRCLNLPEPLYRRIRALSYYLTLSGDGTTVSMAQAISRAMEAYLSDDPRAGKFIGEYDQGMTPKR